MTARGNERKAIYRGEPDRKHFLELLPLWRERFRLRLRAYVLMDNHYHFLLETREANLSEAMQWLNVSYTVWFNRRHRRAGHLLQGRFQAVMVEPETWALSLSRYIHLNPARVGHLGLDKATQRGRRQGLGERATPEVIQARLELLRGYRWSSYRAFAGYEQPPGWLDYESVLGLGGGRGKERRRLYRQDCEAALKEGELECPWEAVVGRLVLGSQEFLERLLEKDLDGELEGEVKARLAPRPSFAEVVRAVEGIKDEAWSAFRDRRGDWGRDLALHLGRQLGGMCLAALAQEVDAGNRMTVSVALRRFGQRLSQDKPLRKRLAEATKALQRHEISSRKV